MSCVIVDFPEPDCPTRPIVSLPLILKLIPFKIHASFLVGYQNQTSLNSISPFIVSLLINIGSSSLIANGSILLYSSMIVKIFFAACMLSCRWTMLLCTSSCICSKHNNKYCNEYIFSISCILVASLRKLQLTRTHASTYCKL